MPVQAEETFCLTNYIINTHHTGGNTMANKNPFEIRFDVLAMAKEMLDKQYEMAQANYYNFLEQVKDSQKTFEDVEQYVPKMYQPQEVMEKAEELYKFIMKKD